MVIQDELLGQAACRMARSRRSFACPGTGGYHLWRDFQSWSTSRWTIFHFWCVSRRWPLNMHKPSAWTCRSRVSSSQLAQDRTSDTVSESQSLRGRIRFVPSGPAPPDPEPRSLRSRSEKWAAKTNEKSWLRSDIKSLTTVSSLNLVIYHVSS